MSQDEVAAIMKTRFKLKTEDVKMSWEQTRILAFYSAFDKLNIKTARQFMPFEWDKEAPTKEIKTLSKDKMLERYEQLIKSKEDRYGKS